MQVDVCRGVGVGGSTQRVTVLQQRLKKLVSCSPCLASPTPIKTALSFSLAHLPPTPLASPFRLCLAYLAFPTPNASLLLLAPC